MEPAAARATIIFLQDAGILIKVFVTDRCHRNKGKLLKKKHSSDPVKTNKSRMNSLFSQQQVKVCSGSPAGRVSTHTAPGLDLIIIIIMICEGSDAVTEICNQILIFCKV